MSKCLIIFFVFQSFFSMSQDKENIEVDVYVRKTKTKIEDFEGKLLKKIVDLHNKKNKIKISINVIQKPFNDIRPFMLKEKNSGRHMFSIAAYTISNLADFEYSAPYFPVRDSFISLKTHKKSGSSLESCGHIGNKYNLAVINKIPDIKQYKLIPYNDYNKLYQDLLDGKINLMFWDSYEVFFNNTLKIDRYISKKTRYLGIIFVKDSKIKKILDPTIKYYLRSPNYNKLLKQELGKDVSKYISKTLKGLH